MTTTPYIWMNGTFVPWKKATVHVLAHSLHYGAGVFEGIRCYETSHGSAIFRLREHMQRLLFSARAVHMKVPFSRTELEKACVALVKKNKVKSCYIRPILFYGYGEMKLNPVGIPVEAVMACWPWPKYLGSDAIRVKLSSFVRIHPKTSVTEAKITGHYVNSIMASLELDPKKYDEALFLDFKGNIAEGPGENFFLVKNKRIFTPKLGTILPGITRDSVIRLARDSGYTVVEKTLSPKDLFSADECFFSGTAAEITGIGSVDGKRIGTGTVGPITRKLKAAYLHAIHGENAKYAKWLTCVS